MKKSIIIAIFALFSLVSCSNNASFEQEQPVKTAATAEITTEAEIPPATEPEISEVLYEDDNCTITYNGFKSLSTYQRINLAIDNKTDNTLSASLSYLKVNGVSIDEHYSITILPLQSLSRCMTIFNDNLQNENITRVNDIDIKMQITVTDKTNGDCLDYYDTDTMTITR